MRPDGTGIDGVNRMYANATNGRRAGGWSAVWSAIRTAAAAMNLRLAHEGRAPHRLRRATFSDHLWRDIGMAALDGMDEAERAVRQSDLAVRGRDLRWK